MYKTEKDCLDNLIDNNILNEKFLQPYKYTVQSKEESLCKAFAQAFNYWLKIPTDILNEIISITQTVVFAMNMIYDINENSSDSKSIPAAHEIYGLGGTINSANYIGVYTLERLLKLHPEAIKQCTEININILKTTGMVLYWKNNNIIPTEEEYKKIIQNKNTIEILFPMRLIQLFSEHKYNLDHICELFGLFLVLSGDYLNIQKISESSDNISQGLFSLPVIHAVRTNPDNNELQKILQKKTYDKKIFNYCISLLESYGSIDYTRNSLRTLENLIRQEIKKLGGNPALEQILDNAMIRINKS